MYIIVAGQNIVTASDFFEVADDFDTVEPLDLVEEFIAGGLFSRDALESFLADVQVETDIERENAEYYAELLHRMPASLHSRPALRVTTQTGVAA